MNGSHRSLRDIRFEEQGRELSLVLTIEVGSEIVVERISLGTVDPQTMNSAIAAALTDLQERKAVVESAA